MESYKRVDRLANCQMVKLVYFFQTRIRRDSKNIIKLWGRLKTCQSDLQPNFHFADWPGHPLGRESGPSELLTKAGIQGKSILQIITFQVFKSL
jgi:hypothetical protein